MTQVSRLDGICLNCGSDVEECDALDKNFDYKNRCTNPECIHHEWHYMYDMDTPEYYKHNTK